MAKTPPPGEKVAKVVRCWPEPIQAPVLQLRALIFATAKRIDKLPVDETLKWGEPAYSTHKGSTIRLGWSDKSPEHYRLHFICTSKLGDAYRELYGDILTIEARRALVFHQSDVLPADAVSSCIALAMRYHEIKHLPNLGC